MNAPSAAVPSHPIAQPAGDAPLLIVINGASGHLDTDLVCGTISGMLDTARRRHEFLRIPDPARMYRRGGHRGGPAGQDGARHRCGRFGLT